MPELTTKLGIKKPLGNETVSRAAFNENWDIIDANAQKNIIQSNTAPASPVLGDLWIDTSTTPNSLKKYNGTDWDIVGAVTPEQIGAVKNNGNVPSIQSGLDAEKPTAGATGQIYIATDTQLIYRDTGTAWQKVGAVKWGDIDGKPSNFTPSAHKSTHATGGADALTPADIGAVSKAGDTIKPSTDSTTAFQVQKSDGSIVLDVDTTNKRVGIQTNSPDQPLTVAGNIKTTNQFISTVATGTAPLQVSSTTLVPNLNVDMVDGYHANQLGAGLGWVKPGDTVLYSDTTTRNIGSNLNLAIYLKRPGKYRIKFTAKLFMSGDSGILYLQSDNTMSNEGHTMSSSVQVTTTTPTNFTLDMTVPCPASGIIYLHNAGATVTITSISICYADATPSDVPDVQIF
ncbi:hypothetical protein Q2T46_11795 [Thermoanaerobacterium sp. CMT5567-10]|uniref:hypothetical protein n=1 Tax=Thermoanaerobacterium sp. CMT5567-10 TaxID=3061989 RepID=UPI0026E10B50|nr:hypothetical protein [Thermoanaerobacterium sp. CMT5567-10]WKV08210.1 hypothetical protein Q2T46_11795 [Thermoanaerobacterium sp. CMT5567-10]